jgi:predicted dehydrogenase
VDPTLRIGISGTGRIAEVLARCAPFAPEVRIVAVSSRDRARAQAFATRHDIAHAVEGDAALAARDDIDLVYVASLNPFHHRDVLRFLAAGKHVLCEKPFAMNAREADDMIAAARAHDRFLMDALWSRFLPSWQRARALVDQGAIGPVRMISAELGFATGEGPEGRLLDRAQGGGSLIDSGVYPHALVSWFLGAPDVIQALGTVGPTGVDEQTLCTLGYSSGAHAQIRSSLRAALASAAFLAGPDGVIELAPRLHRSTRVVVRRLGRDDLVEDLPYESAGLQLQLTHVARCIAEGRRESPVMPLAETRSIVHTMDRIRAQLGVRYAADEMAADAVAAPYDAK